MTDYPFRKQLIEEIAEMKGLVTHVEWLSARDDACCVECARRNGQKFTLAEATRLLKEDYCAPGEPGQGCRCTIVAVID